MMFVPLELFDALAAAIERIPTPYPWGAAKVEMDGTHYAALFDRSGLRIAAREGSPVTLGDIQRASFVVLEELPPHVRAKMDRAVRTKVDRLVVILASRLPAVDVDAAPAD